MSRVDIIQDIPAHICWKYIHGELSRQQEQEVHDIIIVAIPNECQVIQMIRDIAYRTGFDGSVFSKFMSETTYRVEKQWCRNQICEIFKESEDTE